MNTKLDTEPGKDYMKSRTVSMKMNQITLIAYNKN